MRKGLTIYDMPLKVGYYARVSTDKYDQLNSLENQQKYFEEMIKENKNWQLINGYIDEGISGTAVKHRNSFLKMIEDATLGKIDLILTKEISRFSRNTIDSIKYTEYLLKKGVIVYFLSDNLNTIGEDSEFRLTIMSSLAQDEVRKLSERVKFGINRMIKDGKLIGSNLTGYYKKNGRYKINPEEAPLIKYLFTTYVSGNTSLKKIGKELAIQGYLNSKGKPYSGTTLAKFLTNPRYKGYYTAHLTEVEDYKTHKKRAIPKEKQIIYKDSKIPPIISEELWNKANYLYNKRKKLPSRHILNNEEHLKKSKYSNILYCHECGNIFIRNAGSNRALNPIWVCKTYKNQGLKACSSPNIKEKSLDNIFIPIFTNLLNPKKINTIFNEYKNIIESNSNKIILNKNTKEKLLNLNIKGIIDDEELKEHTLKLNKELDNLNKELNIKTNNKTDSLKEELNALKTFLNTKLDIKENLASLIKLLITKIEVTKINGNRKNLSLKIIYNFNYPDTIINLTL